MPVTRIPGLRRVDHIGITVPDLAEAHVFFTDVLGAEYMYRLGPFEHSDDWMSRQLNVDDRAVMERLHFYRLGGQAIFEGHLVALYLDDLDSAVQALHAYGRTVLGEPVHSSSASAGQRWIYFLSPWGMQFELVSDPGGKAFDHRPEDFA